MICSRGFIGYLFVVKSFGMLLVLFVKFLIGIFIVLSSEINRLVSGIL